MFIAWLGLELDGGLNSLDWRGAGYCKLRKKKMNAVMEGNKSALPCGIISARIPNHVSPC